MNPQLVALHKYWCTADAVKQFVSADLPNIDNFDAEDWVKEIGSMASTLHRMSVWYSLIYVVVEGYKELKCSHEAVDELLRNEEYVGFLRLFRNATFHYQKDPLTGRAQKFLMAKDSEIWIRELNKAFEKFFLDNLSIREFLNAVKVKNA